MPTLILLGLLVGELLWIVYISWKYGPKQVTEFVQPDDSSTILNEQLTCEMSPADMLDHHALPTYEDLLDVACDELEASGSVFEREEVAALLALANDLQRRLEAR